MHLPSNNNITGTNWRYGLPPPDLPQYLETLQEEAPQSQHSKNPVTTAHSSDADTDSPTTSGKHLGHRQRLRGAFAAAFGGVVGAAAAAVGRIPRPMSPRGGEEDDGGDGDVGDVEKGLVMTRGGGDHAAVNGDHDSGVKMIHGNASTSSGHLSVGRYVH